MQAADRALTQTRLHLMAKCSRRRSLRTFAQRTICARDKYSLRDRIVDRCARARAPAHPNTWQRRIRNMAPMSADGPWWNNHTAPASSPRAFLFVHIAKCGGTSITQFMTRHNNYFNLKLDSTRTHLFLGLHSDLDWVASEERRLFVWPANNVSNGPRPDWRTTSVFVEMHEHSSWVRYVIERNIGALRKRYADAGGRLLTFTLLRDPALQLQAMYRQQVPTRYNLTASRVALVPFAEWLPHNRGYTTRVLIAGDGKPCEGSHCKNDLGKLIYPSNMPRLHTAKGYTCPRADVERAQARLDDFDVVGDLENANELFANATAALLGMPRERSMRLNRYHYAIGTNRKLTNDANKSLLAGLEDPSVRESLADVASCDRDVWRHAVELEAPALRRLWTSVASLPPLSFSRAEPG